MARDIGIDLGTANTLIYMKGKGIILREPSVVAVDIRNDTVKFVGDEAKEVVGRTPASIVAVRPLKDGVIADFDIAASMLQLFIKKTLGSVTFNRPRVVICIPSGVTAVERRAVREVAFKAGAKQVAIVEEPMARVCLWPSPPAAWWWISVAAPRRWRSFRWAPSWPAAVCAAPGMSSRKRSSPM